MALIRTLIRCFLLLLVGFPAWTQNLDFNVMGVESGLPSNEVYSVYQDRQGYIWAFTEYGIVKHNGVQFVPVCTNIPFSESAIYKVTESKSGEMWLVNSNARIYKVKNDQAIQLKGIEKLSAKIAKLDETILELVDDGHGMLYFSTHTASYRFSTKTGSLKQLKSNSILNEVDFREIGGEFFTQKTFRDDLPGMVMKITAQNGRTIFSIPVKTSTIGRHALHKSGKSFYMVNQKKLILVRPDKSFKTIEFPNHLLNITIGPNGHVWVSTAYGGLYELDAKLNLLEHHLKGLPVSGVLFDNQSGMWVSTIGNGIFYCNNIHRESWNQIPELTGCISMLKTVNGCLFIGTAAGNLYRVEKNQMKQALLGINKFYINDLIFLDKQYYIGTKISVLKADPEFRQTRVSLSGYGGYSFTEGTDQSLLVLSGSLLFEKLKNSNVYSILRREARPRHIIRRSGNDYLISLRQQISLWNGTLTNPAYLHVFKGKNTSMLRIDRRKNVWICTKGDGLYRLSADNRVTHYSNLPSAVVSGICIAENGFVLLSTNKGVYVNKMNRLKVPGTWKLVQEGECTGVEHYHGKLYMATRQGLSMINMNEILSVPDYPFYFSSFRVNGKHFNRKNIRLTRGQDDLVFRFDLLNYRFPSRKLIYGLKGPSPGKGIVDGTELHFQHLRPGSYQLRVIPMINSVICERKALMISFYVAPAFYETGIFIAAMIGLLIVLIVFITSLVFLRLRKKESQRRNITRLLAKYRLTALKAQVNPHFISNTLSAIQLLMVSGNIDRAGQYIARFSMLIRDLLNYSDKAVASLESELRIIGLTVELEQLRFSDRFEFRKEIDPDITLSKLFIPPLITQPFIENAIWHGLLPLNKERKALLLLIVRKEKNDLVITITDNGVGRTYQKENTNVSFPLRESKGTALMKNRMETLNFLHATNGAGIYIKDLVAENGEPAGTSVRIVFPAEMLTKLSHEQNKEHYY